MFSFECSIEIRKVIALGHILPFRLGVRPSVALARILRAKFFQLKSIWGNKRRRGVFVGMRDFDFISECECKMPLSCCKDGKQRWGGGRE